MKEIRVYCVGWQRGDVSLEAAGQMERAGRVLLRTGRCGCAEYLAERNIPFDTFDSLYEESGDFDALDAAIADEILKAAADCTVCYATPTPGDRAARKVLRECPQAVGDIALYAAEPFQRFSASDWERFEPNARQDALIYEITDRLLASEVKLRLMEYYGDEAEVYFRLPEGRIEKTVLADLDRMREYDHRAAAVVTGGQPFEARNALDLGDLKDIMALLREKCPWDGQQTHESLRKYLLEEAYETLDAIDRGSDADTCEELGDVLLQVVFQAQIAKEHGAYELRDVVDGICRKMVRRHVHVFGGVKAETSEEVARLWQEVKKKEKKYATPEEAVAGISTFLPSLMLAQKAIKRARENGIPLPEASGSAAGRLIAALRDTDEDAETELRRAIIQWMQRIRQESDLDHQ